MAVSGLSRQAAGCVVNLSEATAEMAEARFVLYAGLENWSQWTADDLADAARRYWHAHNDLLVAMLEPAS